MSARAVVRDVGRVLGYPYAEVDAVSKSIPFELNMTLSRALDISPELKKNYQEDARVKRLIDTEPVRSRVCPATPPRMRQAF